MEIVKGGKEYFNKRYIKDHPYSLFIYEDTLQDLDFEDYSNVLVELTQLTDEYVCPNGNPETIQDAIYCMGIISNQLFQCNIE